LFTIPCYNETEDEYFDTLCMHILRLKTASLDPMGDNVTHFVHKKSMLEDLIFIYFYYFTMTTLNEDGKLFPCWSPCVKNLGKEGNDSRISDKFREVWTQIHEKANTIAKSDCSNPSKVKEYCLMALASSKGAHSAKKLGIQKIGDSNLAPQVCLYFNNIIAIML